MATVRINLDMTAARDALGGLVNALSGPGRRDLNLTLGKRLEISLREHFLQRDAEPNKRGWKKQHFWSRLRRATALAKADDQRAVVTVADPALRAKIHGSTIRPKERKWLAIAMREKFYGASPRLFDNLGLFFLMLRGKAWLAYSEASGALRLAYRLVKSVTVPRDPRALPEDRDLQSALRQSATDFLNRRAAA